MAGEKRDEAACISAYFLCVYVLSGNLYGGSSTGGSSIKSPGIHVGGSSTERYGHQRDAAVISLYRTGRACGRRSGLPGIYHGQAAPLWQRICDCFVGSTVWRDARKFPAGAVCVRGRAGIWLCCGGIFSEMVCPDPCNQ